MLGFNITSNGGLQVVMSVYPYLSMFDLPLQNIREVEPVFGTDFHETGLTCVIVVSLT